MPLHLPLLCQYSATTHWPSASCPRGGDQRWTGVSVGVRHRFVTRLGLMVFWSHQSALISHERPYQFIDTCSPGDMPRTLLIPMPVFAGPSLKNHRDELFCVRANHLFTVLTSCGPTRCNSRIQGAVARVLDIGFQNATWMACSACCGNSRLPRVCIQHDACMSDMIFLLATPGSTAVT